jgi:hypothetical protein
MAMQANLLKKLLTRTRQVFPSHTINYLLPDVLPIGLHRSECEIRLFLASDMDDFDGEISSSQAWVWVQNKGGLDR